MIITAVLVFVGFGAVIINLIRWQIIEGEELKTAALDQSLQTTSLTAMRGTIYDATEDKVLAQSASVWTVVLEPAYIEKEMEDIIAEGLAPILELDKETVIEKAQNKNSYFTYLKRRVETSVKDQVVAFLDENGITSGVRLIDDYKRYYPYGTVASTVLGCIGTDNEGLAGLELQYDTELRGTAGRMISAKNSIGTDMPFQYEQLVGAQDGYNLVLTIDETVQSIVEKHLERGIDQYVVNNGAVGIVMNVKTGAIIALASKGDFDPNNALTLYDQDVQAEIDLLPEEDQNSAYIDAVYKQWRNKAVSDTYYPGSVFKMCVGSMGLEEKVVEVDTPFYCDGVAEVEGVTGGIHCWKHSGHGSETFAEGLCNSCNPYFIHIGMELGVDRFTKYFEAFGFTEKTGIDLPAESNSIYHSAENMYAADLAAESMGQNFGITPVQMITGVSAVANGGYLVQPHVVSKIVDSDGNIIKTADTSYKRQVISEETSKTMSEILKRNTESGTAMNGYVAGYRISGKTGTSEKVALYNEDLKKNDGVAVMQYIASYCGYAPAENPEYALLVFFDEPQGAENGGFNGGNAVAGPIFADIMEEILPYLGIKTAYTEEEMEEQDTWAPDVTGMTLSEAYDVLTNEGLSYTVIGDEGDYDIVTLQIPLAGQVTPKGGEVVLYTSRYEDQGDVQVPDFKGCTLSEANDLAAEYGVQISTGGSSVTTGMISYQEIAAGTEVRRGTVVAVTFADDVITDTFTTITD